MFIIYGTLYMWIEAPDTFTLELPPTDFPP
jgi:hypothetical protein